VGGLMLLFSIGFVADTLSRSLNPGGIYGGDDPIHMAYSLAVDHRVREGGWPFDWVYQYGLGAPAFIFRPPGFYLTVEALHLLSFRAFSLVDVHKFAYLLALSLYPAGIFYFLRKFRFSPLVCGIGALLAIAPISAWGHTIDAYYHFGLAKQAFAILAVPFTLGKLHGIVSNRERIAPAALLFGFMFLNHPYKAWGTCLIAGLYFLIEILSSSDWRAHLIKGSRLAVVFVSGALLISFWLFPFYSSYEIHRTTPYSSSMRAGFTVQVDSAASTVHHYLSGSLLDAAETPEQIFGHGITSVWYWKNQPGIGRWPILSWGSLLGALLLLARFRSRRNAFFVAGWLATLILFLGPDDVPWLRLIPFQKQVQYVHLVPFLELFAISLAAIGIGGIARGLSGILATRLPGSGVANALGSRNIVLCAITVAITVPLVWNVYAERAAQARRATVTRTFEIDHSGQTPWSLRIPANRALEEATDRLVDHLSPFQRFYGSPTSAQAGKEIYHFTLAPAYLGRANLISPLFGGLVGGANNLVHSSFRKRLWKSRTLTDLLHVDAVITTKENQERYPLQEDLYRLGLDNGRWIVYERKEASRPFHFTDAPPLLVVGDAAQWLDACKIWLESVETLPHLRGVTFLLWEMSPRRGRASVLPLDSFAGVYLADPGIDPDSFFADGELADYLEGGGRIHCRAALQRSDLNCPVVDPDTLPSPEVSPRDADSGWTLSSVSQEKGRHRTRVTVAQPGFLALKHAFYRGWTVAVDGRPQRNYSLSPGLSSVHLPAGAHSVEFRYRGANASRAGNWVSSLTFFLLLGFALRPRGTVGREP
jgi:hypothetical protein